MILQCINQGRFMDYIKFLKSMEEFKLDIDLILAKYARAFSFLEIPEKIQKELNQKIAMYLVQNEVFAESKVNKVILKVYCSYVKTKVEKENFNLMFLLTLNPNLTENKCFNCLAKYLNYEIAEELTLENDELVFDLPFAKTSIDSDNVDTITLLKSCTDIQISYVKNNLSDIELSILYKKFGVNLDQNNLLSSEDEYILNSRLLPKIDKMINRYAGYYFYDQIFADQTNTFKQFGAFYSLDNRNKRVILSCYGQDLCSCIDGVSEADERKLKNVAIPRLREYKSRVVFRRKFAQYQELMNSDISYSLSMLPQGYIDIINLALNKTEKVFSSCSGDEETKALIRGFRALLELILTSEEITILDLHFGLNNNKRYIFKEISEIFNLSENKVNNMYVEILSKLRLSPHIKIIYNMLTEKQHNTYTNDIIKKSDDMKVITNFYGFFSESEINYLQDAIFNLTIEEIEFINSIFKVGLSESISLRLLADEEKDMLFLIVNKLKNEIKEFTEASSEKILWNNVFKICSFICCEPFYDELVSGLPLKQAQILNLCLEFDKINEKSLRVIAKRLNISFTEVCSSLKLCLENIYNIFNEVSKNNITIRCLLEKNNFK